MKLLVERDHLSDSVLDGTLVLTLAPAALLLAATTSPVAHEHVELSDLVSVLARSWHLDGTSPVEVAVTQGKSQLLNL